jgi:hypothetical protein
MSAGATAEEPTKADSAFRQASTAANRFLPVALCYHTFGSNCPNKVNRK